MKFNSDYETSKCYNLGRGKGGGILSVGMIWVVRVQQSNQSDVGNANKLCTPLTESKGCQKGQLCANDISFSGTKN